MRREVTAERLRQVIEALGQAARGPGSVYITGGGSALLEGWRSTTVDVDLKLEPEPAGIFEAIAKAKEQFHVNIELAAPDQFIPAVPGWKERSRLITTVNGVKFLHYDFVAQALAKIERGHGRDLSDVKAMLKRGLVDTASLRTMFESIQGQLIRFPSIDAGAFREKLESFLAEDKDDV